MSKRNKKQAPNSQRAGANVAVQTYAAPTYPVQTYFAGCQRHWDIASTESDLAYAELAFPECPTCLHRVEPEGASAGATSFCTLRPKGHNPFAALAGIFDE